MLQYGIRAANAKEKLTIRVDFVSALFLLLRRICMRHNYLVHHGIGGMKWGKKNGPPYPLKSSDHSAAEKKAGTSGWTKDAKDMTDEELRTAVNRKRMENEYRQYEVKSGKSKKVNNNIDTAKDAARTTANALNIVAQAERTANKNKEADNLNATANAINRTVNKNTKKVNLEKRDLSVLSDSELRKELDRIKLETDYNDLYNIDKGQDRVKKILKTANTAVSTASTAVAMYDLYKRFRGKTSQK